uniref:MutL C-terminal dimerisation domain-containing protein n=1 Tax=Elphidium margaritaceum TaxID=933848 RepID=A0A7S0TCU6_9EUKA
MEVKHSHVPSETGDDEREQNTDTMMVSPCCREPKLTKEEILPRGSQQMMMADEIESASESDEDSEWYEQNEISLQIDSTKFVSAFKDLLQFRQQYNQIDMDSKSVSSSATTDATQCVKTDPVKINTNSDEDEEAMDNDDDEKEEDESDLSLAKLQRVFNKNDALKLQIIGQFNKGFIISQLKHDMFIIDQHATDEKHRFEDLMKHHRIKSQPLLLPKSMHSLTPQQEIAIVENLDVFEANGFKFEIASSSDHEEEEQEQDVRHRVKLVAVPTSLNPHSKISYEFGEDEVLELATLLTEDTLHTLINTQRLHNDRGLIRPSKVRSVFAYRACRGAIMIGKSLSAKQMRNVLDNIPKLDQPWNCPHGRPTMRHLFDLSMLTMHFKNKGQVTEHGAFTFL